MNVEEAIQTLLAVRSYTDQPVPDDVIRSILEAGRLTASSKNKQPWHFVVVRRREALEELAPAAKHGPYIAEAAFAVVVAVEKASPYGLSDASRAVQDMMLVAWEQGVGSNWVGFLGGLGDVNPLLNIPDDLEVVCVVPFGYPAQNLGKGKKQRKPLEEIVHWDRW
ncbi:MAG: nitroreductase family protein [Thermomicrobiales bacterium]